MRVPERVTKLNRFALELFQFVAQVPQRRTPLQMLKGSAIPQRSGAGVIGASCFKVEGAFYRGGIARWTGNSQSGLDPGA